MSPDGRWIAAMEPPPTTRTAYEPTLLLFSSDGALTRKVPGVTGFSWLPDSSGLFVATSLPQRAPDLSIVELDGRVTPTQVQLADQALSRDGKWIVAEHQEGCCVAIIQREIRVSSRDGRVVRTLVRSQAAEPQPIWLMGIDEKDRVVYRDGQRLLRIPLAGGSAQLLGSSADIAQTASARTSPDGQVVLLRSYQPDRWQVVANDRLAAWDPARGDPVEDRRAEVFRGASGTIWIDGHRLLVRAGDGALSAYDAITGAHSTFVARLAPGDNVLAYGHGALVVLRLTRVVVIDLATGMTRESAVEVATDTLSVPATALSGGGFLVSTSSATYRLD